MAKDAARRWIRDWLEMLDLRHPGWAGAYEREGFELAAEDVFGVDGPELSEEELDALGGFVAKGEEDLDLGPAWRRHMIEFEYIFRASHGSSRADDSLRVIRAETLRRVVAAARNPAARRLQNIARALERRRMSSLPDGLRDAREPDPEEAARAREAARRTSKRLTEELSPEALGALRRFLDDGRPASEVARENGISPATMTRALRRMSEIGAEELEDAPLGAFIESLGDASCWA